MKPKRSVEIEAYVYIALMAALICVCSWIAIPFVIPFTLQTFAVFCSLLLLVIVGVAEVSLQKHNKRSRMSGFQENRQGEIPAAFCVCVNTQYFPARAMDIPP